MLHKKSHTSLILLLCWVFISCGNLEASAQLPDLIIINNDTLPLYSLPLEKYLSDNKLPADIFKNFGASCACLRNYRGIWEIRNDSLFLDNIVTCHKDTLKIPFELLFGKDSPDKDIFAYWVTDTLWAETGNIIFYEHFGFGSYYDQEKSIMVDKGVIKKVKEYEYSDSISIPEYFDNHKLLTEYICKNINWKKIPVPEQEVTVLVFFNKDTAYIAGGGQKIYNDEAIRIARTLKPLIIYQHGEKIIYGLTIPVKFSTKIRENCS